MVTCLLFPHGRKRQSIYYSNPIIRIGGKVLPFGCSASQQVSQGKSGFC